MPFDGVVGHTTQEYVWRGSLGVVNRSDREEKDNGVRSQEPVPVFGR